MAKQHKLVTKAFCRSEVRHTSPQVKIKVLVGMPFFLEAVNPFSCLFQLLEATHTLSVRDPSSIFKAKNIANFSDHFSVFTTSAFSVSFFYLSESLWLSWTHCIFKVVFLWSKQSYFNKQHYFPSDMHLLGPEIKMQTSLGGHYSVYHTPTSSRVCKTTHKILQLPEKYWFWTSSVCNFF